MDSAQTVLAAVRDVLPSGPLLVAVSGGPDSAVAAWACIQVAGSEAVRLVHVDHGLVDSPTMRAAANLVAEALELALRVVSVDISGGGSEETRSRIARLAALDSLVDDNEWIVTGHHRDDAAETVLGNLLRGAGAVGLSGISARRDRYVRPLLTVPGDTIRDAADLLRLPYRNDPANVDPRHRRNVIRHRLLPGIEAELGLDVKGALHRTGRILSADDALIETHASAVPIGLDHGAALVPASLLATLPRPVASRVVRRAIRRVRPPYPGSAAEVASVLEVAADGGRRQLLSGWHAVREDANVAIVPALELPPVEPAQLVVPGRLGFGHGHVVSALLVDHPERPRPLGRSRVSLDPGALGGLLDVRCAESGERIDLGGGSKTVRDALAEAGIPVRHRATWPVVAVHERIAWVPGVRIGAWALAAAGAQPVVTMHWERTSA